MEKMTREEIIKKLTSVHAGTFMSVHYTKPVTILSTYKKQGYVVTCEATMVTRTGCNYCNLPGVAPISSDAAPTAKYDVLVPHRIKRSVKKDGSYGNDLICLFTVVHNKNGVKIPQVKKQYYLNGRPVAKSEIQHMLPAQRSTSTSPYTTLTIDYIDWVK